MCQVLHMARCTNVIRLGHLALHSGVVSGYRIRKLQAMKKKENGVRNKMVVVRMNASEFEAAEKIRKRTTEKYLSTYLRKLSLQKPVLVKYRNQSADDFLESMLELKKELGAMGNNFNQAVHKLHLLEKIPEFRIWVQQYDQLHQAFITQTAQINCKVNQLYEQWSQK